MIEMRSEPRLRITVLRTLDPSELFDMLPVAEMDWMVHCEIFQEGQEFFVGEGLLMPEGFCALAWRAIDHNVKTLLYGGVLPHHEEGGELLHRRPQASNFQDREDLARLYTKKPTR